MDYLLRDTLWHRVNLRDAIGAILLERAIRVGQCSQLGRRRMNIENAENAG